MPHFPRTPLAPLTRPIAGRWRHPHIAAVLALAFVAAFTTAAGAVRTAAASRPATVAVVSTTVTLFPEADAYVDESSPASNHDTATEWPLELKTNAQEHYPLWRFDTSAIPADATINSGELKVFVNSGEGDSPIHIIVERITLDWNQATVTWNNRPPTSGTWGSWDTDNDPGARTFDIRVLVGNWVNGNMPNHGVTLRGPATGSYERLFRATGTTRPHLDVVYTAQAGTATPTGSPTASATATSTATSAATSAATSTTTPSPTITTSATSTPTPTPTPTLSPTVASTAAPTSTPSASPTTAETPSPSPTASGTALATSTETPIGTPTITVTITATVTMTATATLTPTLAATGIATTETPDPGTTSTPTPTPSAIASPTPTPTSGDDTPTPDASRTATPVATPATPTMVTRVFLPVMLRGVAFDEPVGMP